MKIVITFFLLALLFLPSCRKEEEKPVRSFHMGFTPFPFDHSVEGASYSYSKLATDADIINHHFDDGVPWPEALSGAEFPLDIRNDWQFRKSNTPASHKIYLSVTSINFERTGLASLRNSSPNLPLPAPWDTYRFDQAEVKQAYLSYCKRIVDFFEPDYFAMGIEVNLLYINNPSRWEEYMVLHRYIYAELKAAYPDLVIFSSQVGLYLLDGFFSDVDEAATRTATAQVLEYSDYFAISLYPYLTNYLGADIPEDTFDKLFTLYDKPLAIAETGFTAQNFSIEVAPGIIVDIQSNQEKQKKYIEKLLEKATQYQLHFVINFVVRDYDQLWEDIGSPIGIEIAWRDTGLYDENGNAREALQTWKNYLQRTITH